MSMSYYAARNIISAQMMRLKNCDGYRFNYKGYEFKLTLHGSAFAPYYNLGYRKLGNNKLKFHEAGMIEAYKLSGDREETIRIALELAKKKLD